MTDHVFQAFLREQLRRGMELAGQSDLLDLAPMGDGGGPPNLYLAKLHCKGLVLQANGEIVEAKEFHVGIWFPEDYLRRSEPMRMLTWLDPPNVFHPNIRPPAICLGHIAPGTELVDLLWQVYDIVRWANWASHDALNPEAAQWARNHQDRLPVDQRPLKRRKLGLQVTDEGVMS